MAIVSTLALHAILLAAILSHPPARRAIANAVPMMVSLVAAAPVAAPEVPLKLARQDIVPAQPVIPLPDVTIASEAPAQIVAAAPPVRERRETAATVPAVVSPRYDAAYLQNPAPAYPLLARRMGERGRVMLRVLVNAEGSADKVELNTSSGSARLDSAALETVQHWRFVPARQGARAVAAWVLVPISFSLES